MTRAAAADNVERFLKWPVRLALKSLSAVPQSEMSISGKTVLITGATSGLGLATAMLLAERGAEVVMVGPDRTRSNFMRTEVAKCAAGNAPILFLADLSSQAEIHRLADRLRGCFSRIDVLINNAAAVFAEREVTPDGLEKTFAVNHLAPFALTHLVLDLLRAAPAGRNLTASSEFHSGELDFSNLKGQRQYNWLGAYKRSKLCNILFTYELSRRLAGSTITANCFSPGPTLTRLGDNLRGLPAAVPWLLKRIPSLLAFSEGAARTPLYLASSPDLDGVSGRFFRQCRETGTKQITYDNSVAIRLWNMSQALYESRASAGSRTE
jgi:NAD(P)-dependent dehydrogenase (short-subunit alcohol dehydrogenase family)